MTTTAARIPRPRIAEGTARRQRGRLARTRTLQAIEWPLWAAARTTVRYPKASAVLSVAVTATTPVTLREMTGVVVGASTVLGLRLYRSGSQASEPSLADVAKFRRRQKLIRRRWVTVMTDCGLARPHVYGGPERRRPKILRMTAEPLGVRVTVNGSPVSAGVAAFLDKADKLRAGFSCLSVKVTTSPNHKIELHLRFENPRHFIQPVTFAQLPPPRAYMAMPIGIDEDGHAVTKDLRLPNLFVGAQGSGKSSETWTILRALVESRIPFRLRVFDPKGGIEHEELDGVAYEYVRNPAAWPQFLEHAHSALGARGAAMRARRMNKVKRFTTEFPLDVMLVDELLTALTFGGAGKKVKVNGASISAEDAFMTYLSTARAAGFTVLASTQLAQKEVLGKIRGLFSYLTVLRVAPTEKDILDVLLGSGASKAYPAHELPADERYAGIGYMSMPRGVVKYRGAFQTAAERRDVARAIGVWTKVLRPTEEAE